MMKSSSGGSLGPQEMGKMWVEVCIVSARGLRRQSLWKLQWFAVAWIDPADKYCTRIDASGSPNPVWRTKFSAVVDQDCTLHVEVHCRDPVFLRDKLHGSAQVSLNQFLPNKSTTDLGSFQLRKTGSNQPKGFVDVSIRTSLHKEGATDGEGFQLAGNSNVISLPTPQTLQQLPFTQPPNPNPGSYTYTHPPPYPSYPPASGPIYQPPRTPPSHAGYVPTFIPRVNNASSSSYMNLPPSAGGASMRPGFAAGMGAGALAAGAVIFGDDLMSGFDLPSVLNHPSFGVSIDPPF